MRVLFAVHGYKPAYRIGGPVHSVSALAEGLARRGHEVVVFTTNSNLDCDVDVPVCQPVDVGGVEVWYFQHIEPLKKALPFLRYFAKSLGFLYAPTMAAELKRMVPMVDLVHTHLPFVYPSLAAARAAIRHGKPLFYHQRGLYDPERLRFRSLKKLLYIALIERAIMRRATTLVALTEAESESYRRLAVQTPCRIVPNGVDIPGVDFHASVPAPFPIPEDARVILFMARVHPIKGADTLLEAFPEVVRAIPGAVLVVAGPDEFGLEARFRELAEHQGLTDQILFPGMVVGDAKAWLLARADLFCLPSLAEGFSMAVLEALAAGTPVLITPGCHFAEVEAAGAGRVVEKTPEAVAAAATDMLSDTGKLIGMGRAGREFVASRYSWEAIVDQMLDVYEEGVQRHRHQLAKTS